MSIHVDFDQPWINERPSEVWIDDTNEGIVKVPVDELPWLIRQLQQLQSELQARPKVLTPVESMQEYLNSLIKLEAPPEVISITRNMLNDMKFSPKGEASAPPPTQSMVKGAKG